MTEEYVLINKDTEIEETSITQLGQEVLDKERSSILIKLVKRLTKHADEKNKELISTRISTFSYESNINYCSMKNIFEKTDMPVSILENTYSDFKKNKSLFSLTESIENPSKDLQMGKRLLEKIENKIKSVLFLANRSAYPSCRLSNKEEVTLLAGEGRVIKCFYKDEERTQHLQDKDLLRCCPVSVKVYNNPDDETQVLYDWKIIRMTDKKIIHIKEKNLSETSSIINELGLSVVNRETTDNLSHCLTALAKADDENVYSERIRYVRKGFAYNKATGKIDVENYNLLQPSDKQIITALNLFDEYLHDFKTDNERLYLVTNFKWGLISPFIFAKKQMDKSTKNLIPYPYLMGVGNTGKTTAHGDMVLSMWYDDISDGEVSGGRVETVPQIAYEVEESTFPKVFDEAGAIFENEFDKRSRDRLKDLINRIKFRHTRNKSGREFKSINSFMITSNGEIHDTQTGVTRRLLLMNFTDEEYKTEEQVKKFNRKYSVGEPENRLYTFKYISHAFANHVIHNPDLLKQNWMKVVDDFLTGLYNKLEVNKPELLSKWIVAQEMSITEEKRREEEHVKHALIRKITENRRYSDVSENPYEFVKFSIYKGISGMDYLHQNDMLYITITRPFLDELAHKHLITKEYDLKTFSNRFGWEYQRTYNNMVCKIEYNKLVAWLYPNHPVLE